MNARRNPARRGPLMFRMDTTAGSIEVVENRPALRCDLRVVRDTHVCTIPLPAEAAEDLARMLRKVAGALAGVTEAPAPARAPILFAEEPEKG